MQHLTFKFLAIAILSLFFAVFFAATLQADTKGLDFHSNAHVMADIDASLLKARQEEKLVYIALGANWCHDSTGLATKLKSPEIEAVMAEHYVPLLVNVGYYDEGINVAERFGRPTIFSTPTVLIIDPETGKQVNGDTMHRWSRSADISIPEMRDYLTGVANLYAKSAGQTLSLAQQRAYGEIDAFEAEIAKRISRGFALVGPLMRAEDEGQDVEVNSLWRPLAKLRFKLMEDLTALRQKVRDHQGDEPVALVMPTYGALPWEEAD